MEFSLLPDRPFVWARLSGPCTIDEICSKVEPILTECLARMQDLLLIDLTGVETSPVSTLDRYRMGSSIISFSGKLRKVATAAPPDFIDPERFGERVARNRGVNIRVFDQLERATKWLLDPSG
jgi:hypothetical protein